MLLMSNTNAPDCSRARQVMHDKMMDYAAYGMMGHLSIECRIMPLKRRYDNGERTESLYQEIMALY